jgi:RHS repeat-associated protein
MAFSLEAVNLAGVNRGNMRAGNHGERHKEDLTNGMNLGYTGKPYDRATGLYNYGYRDYKPEAARFTTVDPIRDGANWFAYVNNDPVNYVDLWGLDTYTWIKTYNLVSPYNNKVPYVAELSRDTFSDVGSAMHGSNGALESADKFVKDGKEAKDTEFDQKTVTSNNPDIINKGAPYVR